MVISGEQMSTQGPATTRILYPKLASVFLAVLALTITPAWSALKMTPTELRRLQLLRPPDLVIVDVRDPNSYAQGHIQGAKNIPIQALSTIQLPKNSQIVVYCGEDACPASDMAAQTLLDKDYSQVQALAGGFAEWLSLGYPTQAASRKAPNPKRRHLSTQDAKSRIDDGQLIPIDVRPAREFAAGHIPKARNLPLEQLETGLAGLPKDRKLIVYDRVNSRARKAASILINNGLDVDELAGGLAGWLKSKGALEVK